MNSKNIQSGVILVVEKMNWGEKSFDTGAWSSTKWTVSDNRKMICEVKYDRSVWTNTEEKTYITENILDVESFEKLKKWTFDTFPSITVCDGFDGVGWEITSYDGMGNKLHTKRGYICDDIGFEIMLKI